MVLTIKNNETLYLQRKIAKAKQTKKFMHRLGYPSLEDASTWSTRVELSPSQLRHVAS